MNTIPVFKPQLYGEPKRLLETLKSSWWGTGPVVAEFEKAFADYIGVVPERCIMLNSCTAALHLAVKFTPSHRRFLVPSLTFVSIALAPRYEDKVVEFVEVGDDLCVDPYDVLRHHPTLSDVVIAVHLGGQPAKLDEVRKHCWVIEDCAHALGSFDGDQHVGTTTIGCFSFQATKGLPIGDGGMLVLPDGLARERRERMLALSWCGIEKTTWDRTTESYQWEYEVNEIGYKYRANDLQAALALDQWPGLIASLAQRHGLACRYTENLEGLGWLKLPPTWEDRRVSWQEYIIRTPHRDRLHDHLMKHGISTTVHYHPIHLYKPFWRVDDGICGPQSLPKTEALAKEILTIPCYAGMTDEEQERVIDGIRSFRP